MRGAGLQSRWPRWPVTFAVVGVIVAGGAAAVAKWPHAWWWLVVVMVAAAAAIPRVLAALSQGSQRRQEIGRAARAGLQGTTGTGGRNLPTAGTADLEARVHQSVLPIPYIQRDEEDTIRAYLRARHPVLLIGSSMVGKTKMAARVIAEEFGSWPVAIPDSKTALADLDAKDVTLRGSVIWLDDIDRLIGADGITDGALRRLTTAGNIIVGTIRARAYDQFRPSDQLRPPEWDVLSPDLSSGLMAGAERQRALFVAVILAPGYDGGPAGGPGGRGFHGPRGCPSLVAGMVCAGQGACGSASIRCHAAVIASAHGQLAWIFRRRRRPPRTRRAAACSTR